MWWNELSFPLSCALNCIGDFLLNISRLWALARVELLHATVSTVILFHIFSSLIGATLH